MANKVKNIRIEYSVEATVNTGNFSNVRPGYKVSADVPEGMHPEQARNALKRLVDGWLEADVDAIKKEMSE